jgi:hypothetical protein
MLGGAGPARAQSCCAGTGAVTPGRLALHEWALAGAQVRAGAILGSFDSSGRYASSPPGASELDYEQDLFGAVRFLQRGQVALLLPLVETRRTSQGAAEAGGGIGDVNASVRYDFVLSGTSRLVPGVALLAGLTVPTGTPPDAADLGPLATGATGTGAYQVSFGAALEQVFGPWLVGLSAFVAQRTARTVGSGAASVHERLGAQWTMLAVGAYTFPNDAAAALSLSYTIEGDATIGGVEAAGSARRLPTVTLSGAWPLDDAWRLQGALYDNLPVAQLGLNQPAGAGLLATVVRSWM